MQGNPSNIEKDTQTNEDQDLKLCEQSKEVNEHTAISTEDMMKSMESLNERLEERRNARDLFFKKKLENLEQNLITLFENSIDDPNFSFRFVNHDDEDDEDDEEDKDDKDDEET